MKRISFILLTSLVFVCAQTSLAQFDIRHLTLGVVSTEVFTQDQDHRMTDIKNPVGMGAVLGYQFNQVAAAGLTMQYMDGTIEHGGGTEKDLRTSLSLFIYPVASSTIRPYVSAGMVYTNRKTTYDILGDQSKDLWHARIGIGAEYPVLPMVTLTADLGTYNDGMRFVAGGGSLGLRFTAR
jgi:outer membrane protein W